MQKVYNSSDVTKREITLLVFCLVILSILYATPRLFSQGFSLAFLREFAVDCIIMSLACLVVWWLQFRRWAHLPLKRRFALHFVTGILYYAIWMGLYQIYNRIAGLPPMNGRQIFQNIGPNLLFYIQVFSSLHIDLFFREREAQHQREQELQRSAHRAEINALKAQIQPHFLFNTLNSISASVPAEQENTRVQIARLADIFRYTLHASQYELVPLTDELDFIRTYLSLEKERFGARLTYKIETNEALANVYIPPMLLQPIVENAIKHGIEPAIDGGTVFINCSHNTTGIFIRIENTGCPCHGSITDLTNGQGVGLSNTAKRLQTQYGQELQLSIAAHGGLIAGFHIPL